MHKSIIYTVKSGLEHALAVNVRTLDVNASLCTWRDCPWLQPEVEDAEDIIFVWVGQLLPAIQFRVLPRLHVRGHYVVLYNSDELDRGPNATHADCERLARLRVRAVWDYSFGNVLHCIAMFSGPAQRALNNSHWTDHARHRHVPPGFTRHINSTLVNVSGSKPRLLFVGGSHYWYDKRVACLRYVNNALNQLLSTSNASICEAVNEKPRRIAADCPLLLTSKALTDAALARSLQLTAFHLNVDKDCNRSNYFIGDAGTPFSRSCNTLRFANLLAAGALIFSEPCHPADEHLYRGLVEFVPIGRLPQAVVEAWHNRRRLPSARHRSEQFARRLAPAGIFERAGLLDDLRRWMEERAASVASPLYAPPNTSRSVLAVPLRID